MRYSIAFVAAALASFVSAHGVISEGRGSGGADMPGVGTPGRSINTLSSSEADPSIIRANEMGGESSVCGRTQGGSPVNVAAAIATFLGGAGGAPAGAAGAGVAAGAGQGASQGLPTADDDGIITMTFHQVDQDGAGPLTAQIDPTSGGTDPAAFQDAVIIQNLPSHSTEAIMDFPVKVRSQHLTFHNTG